MTVVIDSELTLELFYSVSEILFAFLLTSDCRFVCWLSLIIVLSLLTVLLIIQSLFLIQCVLSKKIS